MYRGPIQWGQTRCMYIVWDMRLPYTHTHRGKHYTCLNMVHTIHTHTNSCTLHARCELVLCTFSSIELLVCMFKRTLILFSISVWDWAFVLVMCCSLLFYIIDNFCMWSYLVTGSLYIHVSCNMRLTTPCETMLSQFFKNLAFCLLLHLQWIPSLVSNN